jgi:hypothetical protein
MEVAQPRAGGPDAPNLVSTGPAETLGAIADRALTFQGYLLRRAWGVYYAIWAAAIAGFIVVPATFASRIPSFGWPTTVAYYAFLIAVTVVATWATSWTFGQTIRAIRLREARTPRSRPRRRFLLWLGIGFSILALIAIVASENSYAGLLAVDACLGVLNIWILIAVRRTFPRIPAEASVAVGSYAVSVLGSAFALVVTHSQTWFALLWIVAILGWGFSAVYALYHAPEELAVDSA